MLTLPSYVAITPARNEEQFIGNTLRSMVTQTRKPMRWVIVSDGSTDRTDEIVQRYAAKEPWIELLRMPERDERHFAGKVLAFNAGLERVRDLPYEALVSLDADVTFEPDYFSFLLERLAENPSLGLVGTPFREVSGESYDYRFVSIEHVSGACQVFRRSCYEAIGGYVPIRIGCIDHVAVITARMKGWKTRTFTEKACLHHRKIGTAQTSSLSAKYKVGTKDYALGSHPFWELCRAMYQMTQHPMVVGGIVLYAGYVSAFLQRTARPVSREFVAFHRREQLHRLKRFLLASRQAS